MSEQESIIYGCIKDVSELGHQERNSNRAALLSLSQADGFSFLYQEMFTLPSLAPLPGAYQTEVIHFGASYQAIEYEWSQWISSFEKLLEKMYWHSAVVHLETELTGIHSFYWQATNQRHTPDSGNVNVRCEWVRERGLASIA